MSEIQRREFLTGAAAVAAATTAILAGSGQAEAGPPETGDNPPEPIRGNQGATTPRPDETLLVRPRARTGSGRR